MPWESNPAQKMYQILRGNQPPTSMVGAVGFEPTHLRIKSPLPYQLGYAPIVCVEGVEPS